MSEVENYVAALERYEQLKAEVEEFGAFVLRVGERLSASARSFSFSNVEIGMPGGYGAVTENAHRWKSAVEIQQMLAEWHKAWFAANHFFDLVPDHLRQHLRPPPAH